MRGRGRGFSPRVIAGGLNPLKEALRWIDTGSSAPQFVWGQAPPSRMQRRPFHNPPTLQLTLGTAHETREHLSKRRIHRQFALLRIVPSLPVVTELPEDVVRGEVSNL